MARRGSSCSIFWCAMPSARAGQGARRARHYGRSRRRALRRPGSLCVPRPQRNASIYPVGGTDMSQKRTANQGNQASRAGFESEAGGRADSGQKQEGQTATPGLRPTAPGHGGDRTPPWEQAKPGESASPPGSGKGAGCLGAASGIVLAIVTLVLSVAR